MMHLFFLLWWAQARSAAWFFGWFAIHNALAHPLLLIPGRWPRRFHDWTAGRMP